MAAHLHSGLHSSPSQLLLDQIEPANDRGNELTVGRVYPPTSGFQDWKTTIPCWILERFCETWPQRIGIHIYFEVYACFLLGRDPHRHKYIHTTQDGSGIPHDATTTCTQAEVACSCHVCHALPTGASYEARHMYASPRRDEQKAKGDAPLMLQTIESQKSACSRSVATITNA